MKVLEVYSVSQINSLIKATLENNLPARLTVRGEVSDWKHHSSGHCYFSLKDENALLPCIMWKSKFRKIKFKPEDGIAVLATGYIDVYVTGGKYQFYVEEIEPAGVGALQLAFEQMFRRLEAQGLFKREHKKALPVYPERIGILTSQSGAAIEDIKNSIYNRWPCVKLFLYPVPVQGEAAAEKIAAAIKDINKRNEQFKLDVLIVGRGGGSLEDLWAFNEEVLARAIFDSKIPIISAVGHEIDTTISDLVADARASTPTRAGVIAVPDRGEVLERLASIESRLGLQAKTKLDWAKGKLETVLANAVFKTPFLIVHNKTQQLDELCSELADSVKQKLVAAQTGLNRIYEQITKIEPHRLLAKKTIGLNELQNRTKIAMAALVNKARIQLTAQMNRLAGLNPKSVLKRGYSITANKRTGLVIKRSKDVKIADLLITELANKNLIESKVTKK